MKHTLSLPVSLIPAFSLSALLALTACSSSPQIQTYQADSKTTGNALTSTEPDNSWWQSGRAALAQQLQRQARTGRAKNVILFVGDGMGPSTVTAARIFDGQSRGDSGEENQLSFERFPHTGLVKTYNVDAQVADSAGTASALNTGVKTLIGAINIWPDKPRTDCYGPFRVFPKTFAERAEQLQMSTGIVTTTRVTHATPAAVFAHSPTRNWEDDSDMPEFARQAGCIDIAAQMIGFEHGNGLDLVLGGGRDNFLPASLQGRRNDGRNLTREWQQRFPDGEYVEQAATFRQLDSADPAPVLGLFSNSHMSFEADRDDSREPSLAEMTRFAINKLAHNDNGYFLMIEGGRIDHAHHNVNAYRALSDTQALHLAVAAAVEQVDLDETLILVTADHSHTFTMAGYPVRGNPILGLVRQIGRKTGLPNEHYELAGDQKPYTTLGYQNGLNPRLPDSPALTQDQTTRKDYQQQGAVLMESETHGGEDVAIYAIGPQAQLVSGVLEQHVIFHIMAHAVGWQ